MRTFGDAIKISFYLASLLLFIVYFLTGSSYAYETDIVMESTSNKISTDTMIFTYKPSE